MLIRVAVVAGCNYTGHPAGPADEPRPPALHFAEADAQAMADLLKEQGFAVSLLLGRTATRAGILALAREGERLASTNCQQADGSEQQKRPDDPVGDDLIGRDESDQLEVHGEQTPEGVRAQPVPESTGLGAGAHRVPGA